MLVSSRAAADAFIHASMQVLYLLDKYIIPGFHPLSLVHPRPIDFNSPLPRQLKPPLILACQSRTQKPGWDQICTSIGPFRLDLIYPQLPTRNLCTAPNSEAIPPFFVCTLAPLPAVSKDAFRNHLDVDYRTSFLKIFAPARLPVNLATSAQSRGPLCKVCSHSGHGVADTDVTKQPGTRQSSEADCCIASLKASK